MRAPRQDAQALFAEAFQRKAAERASYLDRACAGNPGLRQEVESLLHAYDRAGDFLGRTGRIPSPDFLDEGVGTLIGRYRLLEKIGEGGFGVVYLAEQKEPVQRKVALKIIKPGMDSKEVIGRFEAERQALALMDHPNIAKVLDAGATPAGRPYFVMELVAGLPMTDYCTRKTLTTLERLQLFIPVCHAVEHAHQKGIIHRDLKPSNVLVTLYDDKPVPKVIDFGVAKALGQKLTEKTLFTASHRMIGTPAYMSPEQASHSGSDIDTRSDVYSLGAVLYELLTGATPLDTETLRRSTLDEIRRIIRDTDPPKPSTRLLALDKRATDGVRPPHGKADPLTMLVRRDLDCITMKSLEKDRQRRYQTASALALDLERLLRNEPVMARPPTALYSLQKLARRHRVAFAVAATVAFTLMLGFVTSTWQAVRARRAERLARIQAAENAALLEILERTLAREDPGGERIRQSLLGSTTEWLNRKYRQHDPQVVNFVRTVRQNMLNLTPTTLAVVTGTRSNRFAAAGSQSNYSRYESVTNLAVGGLDEQFRAATNAALEPLLARRLDDAAQLLSNALAGLKERNRVPTNAWSRPLEVRGFPGPWDGTAQPLLALVVVSSPDQVERRGVAARRGLVVQGPQFLRNRSFKDAVGPLFGNPITELQILILQKTIMDWCRSAGHSEVEVVIPGQEIAAGTLQVAVVEGRGKRTR